MDWIAFIAFMSACAAAATTGAVFPPGEWYERLDKPGWTPPKWLFPVAWTVLYIAIAVAAARVASEAHSGVALAFWSMQIALNALWTPVFFGLRRLDGGMVVIGLLWVAVAATLVAFLRIDTLAGLLFVPYLIWVSYAGALNFDILRRNGSTVV